MREVYSLKGQCTLKQINRVSKSESLTLLNFLWSKGFIYGYSKEGFKVTIYLKYLQTGRGSFYNFLFLSCKKNSLLSLKKKKKIK